jgi:hypothetical protein
LGLGAREWEGSICRARISTLLMHHKSFLRLYKELHKLSIKLSIVFDYTPRVPPTHSTSTKTYTTAPINTYHIITTTMSSQTYVYIPNLVGRQMLRIPITPCEETDYTEDSEPSTTSTYDFSYTSTTSSMSTRDSSPSPSVSVEEVDELE